MREYGFSLTRILLYKDKIYDFAPIRENTGQWKPIFLYILCSANITWNAETEQITLTLPLATETRTSLTFYGGRVSDS